MWHLLGLLLRVQQVVDVLALAGECCGRLALMRQAQQAVVVVLVTAGSCCGAWWPIKQTLAGAVIPAGGVLLLLAQPCFASRAGVVHCCSLRGFLSQTEPASSPHQSDDGLPSW